MLALLKPLRLPRHRATPGDQLHMTLHFIGNIPADQLEPITASLAPISALPTFDLTPRALMSLPERRTPRLIALETDNPPQLRELQTRTVGALSLTPAPPPRFRPHLTLCRFAHDARPRPLQQAISLPPFRVDRVKLMRSDLSSEGARHSVIQTFSLARCVS
jgi:2'-5' RNA ligase